MRVIMYFMSKQQYSSCFPTRLCEVTIPGTNPIITASIISTDWIPALNRLSNT